MSRKVTLTWAPHRACGYAHVVEHTSGWCPCGRPGGPWGRDAALADVWSFLRRWCRRHGRVPWVAVPELHRDAWHWHAHLAWRAWTDVDELEAAWGRGWVWIDGPGRRAAVTRSRCREVAAYSAKYLAKGLHLAPPGRQSYRVAQGWQPRRVVLPPERTMADAARALRPFLPGEVVAEFESGDAGTWPGVPTLWWMVG